MMARTSGNISNDASVKHAWHMHPSPGMPTAAKKAPSSQLIAPSYEEAGARADFPNLRRFLTCAPRHHSTLHSPHSTLGTRAPTTDHRPPTTSKRDDSPKAIASPISQNSYFLAFASISAKFFSSATAAPVSTSRSAIAFPAIASAAAFTA